MAQVVYILCALTSLGCTVLLMGRFRKTRTELLFWSAMAFLCFSATNILLFVDLAVMTDVDMILLRNGFTFIGVLVLLYGLIKNNT